MFQLCTSNNTATLADALGERLRSRGRNPLLPARVLVPQAGLRRWLQMHLAERLGVVANVDFILPAQFAWELLRAARPELPRQSPFDVEVLRWHLQHGVITIPKATSDTNQCANLAIFDFELSSEQMQQIDALTRTDGRLRDQDPASYEEF